MEITREQIKKVNELYSDLGVINTQVSDMLKDIKDKHGENEIALDRDGKVVKIKEKHLWQEVYYGVAETTKIMREKYPRLFKLYDDQQAKLSEIKAYVSQNFGIDFKEIRFVDIINIVEAITRLNDIPREKN